jgi:hypothetical protein
MVLDQYYRGHGISFTYPAAWSLTEDAAGSTIEVTVVGPETSFWTIWLLLDRPHPEQLMDSAIEAFSQDYDEVELVHSSGELCQFPCRQCEFEFVSLELINEACFKAFQTDRFSVLVLYQGHDRELNQTRSVLESITESLECDLDDDVIRGGAVPPGPG